MNHHHRLSKVSYDLDKSINPLKRLENVFQVIFGSRAIISYLSKLKKCIRLSQIPSKQIIEIHQVLDLQRNNKFRGMELLDLLKGTLWGLALTLVHGLINWAKFLFPSTFKKSIENDTIVITGAGSGIGRLVAQKFSDLGAKIISMDVNEKGNSETVK